MKKSKDWVRQEDLDAMLDTFVEEMGGIPAGMRPNEVADRLGHTANGKFYTQFRDWKRRREAEADLPALDIPEDAKLELESVLADRRVDIPCGAGSPPCISNQADSWCGDRDRDRVPRQGTTRF